MSNPQSDDAMGLAVCYNAVLIEMRGLLENGHLRRIDETYGSLLQQHDHLVALCVARRGVPVAPPDARAEGARIAKKYSGAVTRIALVIEDSGLLAQLIRTAIRGFSVVSKQAPLAVYDDVESAIHTLAPLVASAEPAADVERALLRAYRVLRTRAA